MGKALVRTGLQGINMILLCLLLKYFKGILFIFQNVFSQIKVT